MPSWKPMGRTRGRMPAELQRSETARAELAQLAISAGLVRCSWCDELVADDQADEPTISVHVERGGRHVDELIGHLRCCPFPVSD